MTESTGSTQKTIIPRADVVQTFDDWAQSGRADAMADGHWSRTEQIIERMNLQPDMTMLDVGCGNGYAVRAMLDKIGKQGYGVGIDVSSGMVTKAAELSKDYPNASFIEASAEGLPFEGHTFDHILSVEVIYYAQVMDDFLAEMRRVLKPGGRLWVMVDYYREHTFSRVWGDLLGFPVHYLSEENYRQRFNKTDFQNVKTERLFDPRPVDAETFKPGWGYETIDDVVTFRTKMGSLLVYGEK